MTHDGWTWLEKTVPGPAHDGKGLHVHEFSIQVHIDAEGRHVVSPYGEVDIATHRHLREAINELVIAGNVDLVVDLDHTTFMDSTALGILIGARRRAHALKGSFAIQCRNEELLRLFRVTSLDRVFQIDGPEGSDAVGAVPAQVL